MMRTPVPSPKSEQALAQPPRLISSLRGGFDVVASHLGLILFPLVLDLFLWLGPHFQLKTLFTSLLRQTAILPGMDSPQMKELLEVTQQFWTFLAEHFNLAAALRTYPVGIPSLMAARMPAETPLGVPTTHDLTGLGIILLGWAGFALMGLLLGSLYFGSVARAVTGERNGPSPLWSAIQTVALAAIWLIVLLIINLPAFFLLSVLAMLSPGIAQVATLAYTILLAWIVVPMLFSPHGIYIYRQNALFSMLTSVRLVRFLLPSTGMFFLAIILLSQGLDLLWQVPPVSSWMNLVGIGGHALVSTSLLAASFVYYRDAMRWVQETLQRQVIKPA